MLLAIDIGNTNIVIGCFLGDELKEVVRLKTVRERTIDEYGAFILPLLERRFGENLKIDRAIVSSVVPPLTGDIEALLARELRVKPIIVGPGIKTGLSIKAKDPGAVGADRVVNAVAAKELHGFPSIVIDFGTATSFDVIGASGDYEGGVIAPGIQISLDALVSNTAKLPRIQIEWPTALIGKNTEEAMLSGLVFGYHSLVDGLVERLVSELGSVESVIATGGSGKLFSEKSKVINSYEPNLTLLGLQIIDRLNTDES